MKLLAKETVTVVAADLYMKDDTYLSAKQIAELLVRKIAEHSVAVFFSVSLVLLKLFAAKSFSQNSSESEYHRTSKKK